MTKVFTFSKLAKLGEPDEKYGVVYWGEPNEQVTPVKFNSLNQNITAEDTIEAEEVLLKTSGKGIDYHQLKKVKIVAVGGVAKVSRDGGDWHDEVVSTPKITPTQPQLDRIEAKLDKIIESVVPISGGDPDDRPIYDREEV